MTKPEDFWPSLFKDGECRRIPLICKNCTPEGPDTYDAERKEMLDHFAAGGDLQEFYMKLFQMDLGPHAHDDCGGGGASGGGGQSKKKTKNGGCKNSKKKSKK